MAVAHDAQTCETAPIPDGGLSTMLDSIRERMPRVIMGFVVALSLILSHLLVSMAHAQTEFLLTDAQVSGFISSYPDIEALAEEFQGEAPDSDGDLAASLGALATYQDAMNQLNATVAAHGFADYAEWLQVTSAISLAYIYARDGGAMDQQMQAAIAQIESNPRLSDEQKATVIQQMQAATGALDAQRPPQQNIDVVNARSSDLKAVFDGM